MDFIKKNMDTLLDIAKWTLLILSTGFIAQFGKQFASYLISKFKDKKVEEESDSSVSPIEKEGLDKKQLKQLAKIEKKKAKNLKKSQK